LARHDPGAVSSSNLQSWISLAGDGPVCARVSDKQQRDKRKKTSSGSPAQ
jgi:hypothetical protein